MENVILHFCSSHLQHKFDYYNFLNIDNAFYYIVAKDLLRVNANMVFSHHRFYTSVNKSFVVGLPFQRSHGGNVDSSQSGLFSLQ